MEFVCKGLAKENCLPPECTYINGAKLKYCKKNTTKKVKSVSPKPMPKAVSPKPMPKAVSPKPKALPKPSPKNNDNCKGLSKEHCLPPKCTYINGAKLKYCKPNTKKMNIPKLSSKKINPATPHYSPVIHLQKSSSHKKIISNENKTKKGNIIKKFFIKNKTKLTALFLNAICQDSGVCMAFGKETDKIRSFFNNYINFDYAINEKHIATGANGIVLQIEYERLKYKSFAILKKSQHMSSDNLFYEYLVGQFINSMYKKLPGLLQTYGVFFSKEFGFIHSLNTLQYLDTSTMPNMLAGLRQSCLTPTKTLLLIEHIKGSQTLKEQIKSEEFIDCDLIHTLFQIYFTLNALKDVFTHYDLHSDNILTYIPIKNKYIQYHFHLQNETVTFKSPYLIKIIDYGRCHFDDQRGMNSQLIYDSFSSMNCGAVQGYQWFDKSKKPKSEKGYINSLLVNRSHDLRLLKNITHYMKMIYLDYFNFNNIVYADVQTLFTKFVYSSFYGTTEKLKSGLPKKVHNVMDAFNLLKKICMNPDFKQDNENYYLAGDLRGGFTKIGDLHIYDDGRDMVFTPS